ncbi:sigma-70 family RNA polymerase sigma factor [Arenimonas aestuarii]
MPHLQSPTRQQVRCDEAALVALLGRIRFGDAEALGQLYDQALGQVHGLALRVLGNPQDAEEVVSDVFLQVWDRAVSYCPQRGAVMAWLQTLAWSRAIDHRRKRARRAPPGLHPDDAALAYRESEDPAPEHLAESHALATRVHQALDALAPGQRRVLELAFYEDLSHAEIAERTGMPLGTVKSHARRGLANLRSAMDGEGHAP